MLTLIFIELKKAIKEKNIMMIAIYKNILIHNGYDEFKIKTILNNMK